MELPDGGVTLSPRETKIFRGLDDDFGLKRPNHQLGPDYMHLFRAKKVYYMGRLFREILSFVRKP
jgi:hypothetical protein